VVAVARERTTKEIERYCVERFRQVYALSVGAISYGDKPDVTLTGEQTIYIEITHFYLQSGRGTPVLRSAHPRRN
jgi:hypothetical protein